MLVKVSVFVDHRAEMVYKILSRSFLLSALIVALCDFVILQKVTFHLGLMNVTGVCLFLLGVYIRITAIRTLGKYFLTNLGALQNHRLVKHGVYKYIRHPAYLGTFLFGSGITLFFSSLFGFLLMVGLLLSYLYRIKNEEHMLIQIFGEEYQEYKKRTKKVIPFIY